MKDALLLSLGAALLAMPVRAAAPDAQDRGLAWTLKGSFPDPTGHTRVSADGTVVIDRADLDRERACIASAGAAMPGCAALRAEAAARARLSPDCVRSPVCDNRSGGVGVAGRSSLQRVLWQQDEGYRFTYPYALPAGFGGVPAVALDSQARLWAFKRSRAGTAQLYRFGRDGRIDRTIGDDVIGHALKAHGLAIDAQDNLWITDATRAIVQKLSPEGRLLRTFGVEGRRGDWNEAKGQRLLWQPMMVAFGPRGDIYIAEGHGNESPNDTDSPDPANRSGAARIIHFDRDGTFVNQWYGNNVGEGKFGMAHAIAVDPRTGDVWIGDREQYRIVVYTSDGRFLRTMQMRNLVCAITFDPAGEPWMASGQDGQFLKLDRDGHVLAAVGRGMGIGAGEFIEASYFVFDKAGDIYAGDTSVGRITKIVAPKR